MACEDLQQPDGALVLVPSASSGGQAEWFAKSYNPYVPYPDSHYFLNVSYNVTPAGKHQHPHMLYGKAVSETIFSSFPPTPRFTHKFLTAEPSGVSRA